MAPNEPPHAAVMKMLSGGWLSQMLFVAAKLELADRMAVGPRTCDELAAETNTHPRALYRLLRGLASIGVFAEQQPRQFQLTPMAECLRKDMPGSAWAAAIMLGGTQYAAWGELLYAVQTGRSGFEKVHGQPIFDYLAAHPDEAAIFDAAMTSIHGPETAAMLDAYDLTGIETLVDVGGGNGLTLAGVLGRYPSMRGILFDLPGVVTQAEGRLRDAGMAERITTIGGNFFDAVPSGGDAYLLRHIIHDWCDPEATRILAACRAALKPSGRVLVVESIIPPGNQPSFGKLLDVTMLVIPGGMERTVEEYHALFTAARLKISRIVPTAHEVSVIEATSA